MSKRHTRLKKLAIVCIYVLFIVLLFIETILAKKTVNWFFNHAELSREDIYEMLNDNLNEFEAMAEKMQIMYVENNQEMVWLETVVELRSSKISSESIKKYSISCICAIDNKIKFYIKNPPEPSLFWGVYYVQNDLPSAWGDGKLEEIDDIFIENGSNYIYRTEKIRDNWFYFESQGK